MSCAQCRGARCASRETPTDVRNVKTALHSWKTDSVSAPIPSPTIPPRNPAAMTASIPSSPPQNAMSTDVQSAKQETQMSVGHAKMHMLMSPMENAHVSSPAKWSIPRECVAPAELKVAPPALLTLLPNATSVRTR